MTVSGIEPDAELGFVHQLAGLRCFVRKYELDQAGILDADNVRIGALLDRHRE